MREYGKVAPQFWIGTTGKEIRALGRDAQVIALYLLTCPSSNMLGLYYLPLPTLCHEIGSPFKGALKTLRRLSEAHFAYYDEAAELVWVPEMARYQIGEALKPNDKRVAGINRSMQLIKHHPFVDKFIERYKQAYHLNITSISSPIESPLQAPCKTLRSQEQEQLQEQSTKVLPPFPENPPHSTRRGRHRPANPLPSAYDTPDGPAGA